MGALSWYKIEYRYGPGHQSRDTHYAYLHEFAVEEYVPDYAHDHHIEDWYCDHEKVDRLPDDVKAALTTRYRGMLDSAQYMLDLLERS